MALKLGIEGKPWYVGLSVGLVVGAVLFALGHWQYIQPIKDEMDRQQQKLDDLEAAIQRGRSAKADLPKFREEVKQLQLELDKLLRILPAKRNTPDLLHRIRALTEQGDFALKSFTPGQLTDKEFYSEWPIAVELDGTYHNLALFFDRIGRFSRIINIDNLSVTAMTPTKSNGQHTINAQFTAKTFIYKEPEPVTTTPGAPGAPGNRPGGPAPAAPATEAPNAGASPFKPSAKMGGDT